MDFFSAPSISFAALLSGIIFGFLLRKATVSRFDVIAGQLLLRDFTVMKVILTAIVTGSCGIYLFHSLGWITVFHLSKIPVLSTFLGGSIFGIGMAFLGFCPGTALAALAEGAKDALFGIAGMLLGALLFNQFYMQLKPLIEKKDGFYQQTIPACLHCSPGFVILILFVIWLLFAWSVKKLESRKTSSKRCGV